jgi:hypothetical protein
VIKQPHFDPYSVPARICFAVAVVGGALLIAVAIVSIYLM